MSDMIRPHFLRVLLLALLLALPAQAGLITVTYSGTVIGTLQYDVDAWGRELATFTLDAAYRSLLSDATDSEFRFLQVIYYDDEPVTWGGSVITAAGTAAHTGTVVDTPAGGWDYQTPGGDDRSPFYESDTAADPGTGTPYYFSSSSYATVHADDSYNPGYVYISDAPDLSGALHQTLFETYLVYMSASMQASGTFVILAGFSWGIATDATGVQYGLAATEIVASSIDASKLAELQAALDRSGYSAWQVTATAVPEPAMGATLALALAGMAWRRARRRAG
jgi:hypothetical protein